MTAFRVPATAKQTAAVNAVGAVTLAGAAAIHSARRARAMLALNAVELGAFAVPPALSLIRRRRSAEEE